MITLKSFLKAEKVRISTFWKLNFHRELRGIRPKVITKWHKPVVAIIPYADMIELLDHIDKLADQ